MSFLQGLLAKIGFDFIKELLKEVFKWFTLQKLNKKSKGYVNKELDAVLKAKQIIRDKRKNGEPVLEEDYERLKKANSMLNYRKRP